MTMCENAKKTSLLTSDCKFCIYNKNIFNKNERRCRDFKTQKGRKQGWEVKVGPKIKQLEPLHITLHKYLHCYKAKYKELYLFRVIWKWFI